MRISPGLMSRVAVISIPVSVTILTAIRPRSGRPNGADLAKPVSISGDTTYPSPVGNRSGLAPYRPAMVSVSAASELHVRRASVMALSVVTAAVAASRSSKVAECSGPVTLSSAGRGLPAAGYAVSQMAWARRSVAQNPAIFVETTAFWVLQSSTGPRDTWSDSSQHTHRGGQHGSRFESSCRV